MGLLNKIFSFLYQPAKKPEETKEPLLVSVPETSEVYKKITKGIDGIDSDLMEKRDKILYDILGALKLIATELAATKQETAILYTATKNQNIVLTDVVKELARLSGAINVLLRDIDDYETSLEEEEEEEQEDPMSDLKAKGKFGLN